MNIAGTNYNINHKALEIYISGCDGICEGCHNPELWDYNTGIETFWQFPFGIVQKLQINIVENIWIMGGEPLLQNIDELKYFLKCLSFFSKKNNIKSIWLWTRFYDTSIPNDIKQFIDYAKVGEYQKDSESYIEPLFGIELASKNQKIIKCVEH